MAPKSMSSKLMVAVVDVSRIATMAIVVAIVVDEIIIAGQVENC